MTADDQAAGTDLAEAERTIRADHYPVCRWPHDPMEMPGGCVGECVMDCAAEGEEWPCSTARLLAEYDGRAEEIERLTAAVTSESSAKVSGFLTADVWKSRHDTVVAAVRALADDLDREADEAMRDQNTAHAAEIHELITIANEFPKIAARIRAALDGQETSHV